MVFNFVLHLLQADPYVIASLGEKTQGQPSEHIAKTLNPIFGRYKKLILSTPKNCEKTGTSKGLWDRLGRRMDIAPTNERIFGIFDIFNISLGVAYLLL